MAELCDLLFQANWPEAKQQPSMFGSCLRVNLAMTGTCAADQKLRNSTVCIWCAIVHCSMRISAMRPQPMGYRHRWDHFSPRCPILKDLNQVMAWKMWVALDKEFRKWKWYLPQFKICLLILQGIIVLLQNSRVALVVLACQPGPWGNGEFERKCGEIWGNNTEWSQPGRKPPHN